MSFLTRLSIRNRILLIVLLTFLVLAVCFAWILFYEMRILRQDLVDSAKAMAQVIGESAVIPLQSGNKGALQKSLERVKGLFHIEAIYVFSADGNLFLAYPNVSISAPRMAGFRRVSNLPVTPYILFEPIVSENQTLGSIYLRVSTQHLNNRIEKP